MLSIIYSESIWLRQCDEFGVTARAQNVNCTSLKTHNFKRLLSALRGLNDAISPQRSEGKDWQYFCPMPLATT
jgi:hypothetical protein